MHVNKSRTSSRICIIGGGAGGLAILKILLEAEEYKAGLWELTVFEAREAIGGVWLPSPPQGDPPASPLYDALTTNLPHPVMAFQSHWFPPSTPLFPRASVVLTYLQSYAEKFGLLKHINFNTRVDEALWDGHSWNVQLSNKTTQKYDRIVVANGHYSVPRHADIPGLRDWLDSGRASHSVYYRNAHPYRGMCVLVIGNGPSGRDISSEVAEVATAVYHSINGSPPEEIDKIKRRGKVICFGDAGTVVFENGSASSIDHAILATGYSMSLPFLPQIRQSTMPKIPPLPPHVLNSTYNIFPLARHLFPLQDYFPSDTLAFVGLLIRVVPFPIFEAQGRVVSRVFSQPDTLKNTNESLAIIARYNDLHEMLGNNPITIAKEWHKYPGSAQFSYRREILRLAGAGTEWDPEDWVEGMYLSKDKLRQAWVELERNGLADDWVRGVGEGGRHEWVDMMRRLLMKSKEFGSE